LATAIAGEKNYLEALTLLTLAPAQAAGAVTFVAGLDSQQRSEFLELAESHHVIVRGLRSLRTLTEERNGLRFWIDGALQAEQHRITNALQYLQRICRELEEAGCPVVVMKSLDHTPDLGNDLDLYTTAGEAKVRAIFVGRLHARVEPRSWGDRLAHKWNFALAGLRESVEVHSQRLGQTGEHLRMARRFVDRQVPMQIDGYTFPAPAPEERILVAVLQRMYRHFYFRLCDILNSTYLVESGALDFEELRRAADLGGIWPGVATYLKIVSDYVERYRGYGLRLPEQLLSAARFGGDKLFVQRRFFRIPIMPEGAGLYTHQVAATALHGNVPATLRLSLLPPLAATAAMAFKLTGDDKGIW
jgi:hypothetical protein